MAQVTKNDLLRFMGRKLGYSRSNSTLAANSDWTTDLTDALANALNRFYDPDVVPKHQWSFLKPVVKLQFTQGSYRMELPADFVMLDGPITYAIGEDAIYPPVDIVSVAHVLHRLQQDDSTSGRPRIAALQVKKPDATMATKYELLHYPTSDDDYAVMVPMRINPQDLAFGTALPLGGGVHRNTLIAAAIAEAIDMLDEYDDGRAEARFQRLLAASIDHDQQVSCPETLGYNGDHSDGADFHDPYFRRVMGMNSGLVTYNGAVPEG